MKTLERPRRHPVSIEATMWALMQHGFVLTVDPDTRQWILRWNNRQRLVIVVLAADRGHQAVIPAHRNGTQWVADHEPDQPRDHVAAVRRGLWHLHNARRAA